MMINTNTPSPGQVGLWKNTDSIEKQTASNAGLAPSLARSSSTDSISMKPIPASGSNVQPSLAPGEQLTQVGTVNGKPVYVSNYYDMTSDGNREYTVYVDGKPQKMYTRNRFDPNFRVVEKDGKKYMVADSNNGRIVYREFDKDGNLTGRTYEANKLPDAEKPPTLPPPKPQPPTAPPENKKKQEVPPKPPERKEYTEYRERLNKKDSQNRPVTVTTYQDVSEDPQTRERHLSSPRVTINWGDKSITLPMREGHQFVSAQLLKRNILIGRMEDRIEIKTRDPDGNIVTEHICTYQNIPNK